MAATMTDLHATEYVGPEPEVGGHPVRGEIRAWSPTQQHFGPKRGIVPVWVAAFEA